MNESGLQGRIELGVEDGEVLADAMIAVFML